MRRLSILSAILALLALTEPAVAQVPIDTYFQFDYSIRPVRLQALRISPGGPIQEVASFDLGTSGLSSANDPLVLDPRSGELWGKSFVSGALLMQRFELQNGQVVATPDIIPVPWFSSVFSSRAQFDDDGFLVTCNRGGGVTTIDLRERRIVRTMQIQNVSLNGVQWFVPARRGRRAMAEMQEALPGIEREVIVTLDEQGNVVDRLFERPSSFPQPIYSGQGITTEAGRSFITGLQFQSAPLVGLFEVVGSSLQRVSTVIQRVSVPLEDPARGILHLTAEPDGGRVEFDLRANQHRFVREANISRIGWFSSLGHFPRERLQLSPTLPTANTAFDAALALGGNPNDLGLVLFRHATVGGIPQLELNSLVALAPFDTNGLQRTVLRYDPALFRLQAGDELRFQGFGWNGSSLWATPEQVVRWR